MYISNVIKTKYNLKQNKMSTEEKNNIIKQIKTVIVDLQDDTKNILNSEDDIQEIKLDLESAKTILGNLITLRTI